MEMITLKQHMTKTADSKVKVVDIEKAQVDKKAA